jgi:protoheme IX farnesyltransferase
MVSRIDHLTGAALFAAKGRAVLELLKFRLSFLVAFSCTFGYVLASKDLQWGAMLMVFMGGFLVSGAAVIVNQILERDIDGLMVRTRNRPLPTARLN